MIINGDRVDNFVSTTMVDKFNLRVQRKAYPYLLTWSHKREHFIVRDECLVPIIIRFWKEQAWCDVIPMTSTHIVLGQPRLFTWKVNHDAKYNTYTFLYGEYRR